MKRSEMIETIAIAINTAYGRDWNDLELPMQIMDIQVATHVLNQIEQSDIYDPCYDLEQE